MKKSLLVAGLALMSVGAMAQTNFQFFYDFGENRKFVTTTLEMYKGDNWGSTFFFVDYDYSSKDFRDQKDALGGRPNKNFYGARGSYFEIARALNFWKESALGALSAHVEFNSGVDFGNRNWLFGAEYFLHSQDFSNTLTLELLYKTFEGGSADSDLPLQFTVVWGMQNIFGVDGLNFSGFADFWGEKVVNFAENNQKKADFVFISEPQIWYNVGRFFNCENLNVGAEVELSANFAGYDGFKARPCLGFKWNF